MQLCWFFADVNLPFKHTPHCRSEVEPEQIPLDSFKELGTKFTNDEEGTATYLNFSNRDITDANLISLKEMVDLKTLDISNTPITDAGLPHLKDLTNLTYLNLIETQITDSGVAELQKALPNCKIHK